jgi:lytic cellulose monooxygenase (C1-hydroxylating)
MNNTKGPLIAYLAKVSDSTTTGTSGLSWFKISEDGLTNSNGQWGVDRMIANNGWYYFTMPSCIAPGDYLLRVEIIALHNAYNVGGAQFYMECAQITVTGSDGTGTGSETLVSFPGAYSSTDPGIYLNIYGTGGTPDNGGKPYTIPGPPVLTCGSGGSSPTSATTTVGTTFTTTTIKPTTTTTTASTATTSASGSSSGAALYGQCGGQGWAGPTTCAQGTCKAQNSYYSQYPYLSLSKISPTSMITNKN